MEEELREKLISAGVDESAVAILEDQKLTDCATLQEVEISVLIFCGIKAGTGMQIKRISKMCSKTKDDEAIVVESPAKNMSPLLEDSSGIKNGDDSTNNFIKSPFVFEERKNRAFFENFELTEKFSPAISIALTNNCLIGSQRNEFVRDICTNILANGVHYLNKSERDKVALAIITRYPHLKDPIGSGLGSWTESIKNRFKHIRKYDSKKRRLSETATSSVANNQASSINSINIHQMPKKPRKLNFWNVIPENGAISDGVQEDHVEELKKECMRPKTSQDNAKIKQLMKVTYNKRRSNILTSVALVHEIVQEFPPLATIRGIRHEFGRVMEDENVMKALKERFSKHRIAMVKYCERKPRKTPFLKQALQLRKEAISQEPEKIQEIESTFAVMVLPNLLFRKSSKQKNKGHQEEKADDYQHIYNILNEDEDLNTYVQNVTFPSLIGIGENMFKLDHLYLCVEGKVLVEGTGFPVETVFFTLYATFYIFSIAYPQQYIDFFAYLDSALMGLQHKATNKIVVNKFVMEMNDLVNS